MTGAPHRYLVAARGQLSAKLVASRDMLAALSRTVGQTQAEIDRLEDELRELDAFLAPAPVVEADSEGGEAC